MLPRLKPALADGTEGGGVEDDGVGPAGAVVGAADAGVAVGWLNPLK